MQIFNGDGSENIPQSQIWERHEVMEGYVWIKIVLNGVLLSAAGILTALGVDTEVFAALGWLLFFDYVTGVYKAKTLGHCISSNKMKYGMVSKFSLMLIPIVLGIAAQGVDADLKGVLYVGMNILILSELYSIIGNIYSIRTKQELPEWDAVSAIGHKIRDTMIKLSGSKEEDDACDK